MNPKRRITGRTRGDAGVLNILDYIRVVFLKKKTTKYVVTIVCAVFSQHVRVASTVSPVTVPRVAFAMIIVVRFQFV